MEVLKEENNKIILMIDENDNDYLMSVCGNRLVITKMEENQNSVVLHIRMLDVVLAEQLCQCIDFLTKNCCVDKEVFLQGVIYPQHIKKLVEDGFMIQDTYLVKAILPIKDKERG